MTPGEFGLLVVGAGRGGTTLIAALLDYHPRLAVAFERFSQEYLMGTAIAGDDATHFDVRTGQFMQACARMAARHVDQVWGNKITTEQLGCLEDHNTDGRYEPVDVMDAFFNRVLARQKLVFILRDGRTCVRSKMARTGQPLSVACDRWLYSARVYDFLRRHPRAICIRYESLLLEPTTTLEAVCRFLDIDYDSTMLAGTLHDHMNPEYRRPGLDISKLDLKNVPEGCEERLAEALRSCGYPV